jgi:hypothetical protein
MRGGIPNHNRLALNVIATLNYSLKRQLYQVYFTDQRLWIADKIIPIMIVFQQNTPLIYVKVRRETLVSSVMITEVLSKDYQKQR